MFEHGDEGWCPPLLDEPELTEEQWQAQVEAQIAADPEPWPEPTLEERRVRAAEVIALGESAPITPWLFAALQNIDRSLLTEDLAIGLSVAWQRVTNHSEAQRGLAVNTAVAAAPDSKQIPRELAAAAQLGAALGLGSGGTDALIADAAQIAAMLPGTQAAALAGDLPWRKAASIASNTLGMTPAQAARVEEKVLPKAWERSPARHDAAVRRAVDQVDPDHTDRKRKDREHAIRLARHHYGAGMGELFACMPSEDLDLVWAGADTWARRRKAAGDPRTLDVLRAAFLPQCARSFLSHGDPAHCDTICDPLPPLPPSPIVDPDDPDAWREPPADHDDGDEPDDDDSGPDDGGDPGEDDGSGGAAADQPPADEPVQPVAPSPPTQHGRPVALHVVWDLTSLLGIDSPERESALVAALASPRRERSDRADLATDAERRPSDHTGEQLDLTPITWELPATDGRAHPQPVVLTVTTTARLDDLPDDIRAIVDADPTLREMLHYPLTADDLDDHPDAETPTPALAEYTASRAAHPVNPCAGPTAASAGDIDHHQSRKDGGKTIRGNLGPFVRRWHRLKTFADWTVRQIRRGTEWTSPTGRKYTIEPHDYRLGP